MTQNHMPTTDYLDVDLLSDTICCVNEIYSSWGHNPSMEEWSKGVGLLYERFLKKGLKVDRETAEEYLMLFG